MLLKVSVMLCVAFSVDSEVGGNAAPKDLMLRVDLEVDII